MEPTPAMRQFVERQLHLMLATGNDDGSMHVVPVAYLFRDGCFYIATSSATRKVRNVAARPEVTVTIDDRETTAWVSALGTAELIRGPAAIDMNARVYARWMTEEGLEVVGPIFHGFEDVTIAITPRRWKAWDIGSTIFPVLERAGLDLEQLDRWFLG